MILLLTLLYLSYVNNVMNENRAREQAIVSKNKEIHIQNFSLVQYDLHYERVSDFCLNSEL